MVAEVKTSIAKKEPICDTLVGRFVQQSDTMDHVIKYDYHASCTHQVRDFCVLEKQVCSDAGKADASSIECPKTGRNKRCEQFVWSEIKSGNDRVCLAQNTDWKATHDKDSCRNYAASRLWFRKSTGKKLFDEITKNFKGNLTLLL